MKKILCVLCTILLITGCDNQKTDKKTITIGASLPLTGDLSMYGTALKKSLDLALKDLNKQNLKYEYKVVIEDDRYDLKQVLTNVKRFKSVNNINAVMSFWGSAGTIVSDWAENNKIIHVSCAASDKVGAGYYNFNHATQPKTLMNRMLKYYRDNNFKRVGIIYLPALEIQEHLDAFIPLLESNGFDVVFNIQINPNERDFNLEIQKMKKKSPDVVYVLLQSPTLNIFGKQSKEQNFNVPMVNVNNMVTAIDEYEGQAFVTEDSGSSTFTEHFELTTGIEQVGCVVNFYDAFNMLVHAYENTESRDIESVPNNEDVVKTLLNIKHNGFESVIDNITIDEEGNIDSPAVLKRIINGKSIVVEK